MVSYQEVDGNSVQSTLNYQNACLKAAEQILRFETVMETIKAEGGRLKGMSIKLPLNRDGEVLIVIRAAFGEEDFVAFSSGITLFETLRVTVARIQNKSIKWKEDQYAGK